MIAEPSTPSVFLPVFTLERRACALGFISLHLLASFSTRWASNVCLTGTIAQPVKDSRDWPDNRCPILRAMRHGIGNRRVVIISLGSRKFHGGPRWDIAAHGTRNQSMPLGFGSLRRLQPRALRLVPGLPHTRSNTDPPFVGNWRSARHHRTTPRGEPAPRFDTITET
jgi:hypothetical protein